MTDEEFSRSLESAIVRHARDCVQRGVWREAESLAASRAEFGAHLPEGRHTPGFRFCEILDDATGRRVGETWYRVQTDGGTTRVWIDWIWTDPPLRRRGHAAAALREVEREASRLGATRVGLAVWADNPGAKALYQRLRYVAESFHMLRRPGDPVPPR